MTNDLKRMSDQYSLITEAHPFGLGSKISAAIQRNNPFSSASRDAGKTADNFQTNVNNEFTKFKSWLVSQPDQRSTKGNLIHYFSQYVGLEVDNSPALQKLLQADPKVTNSVLVELQKSAGQNTTP